MSTRRSRACWSGFLLLGLGAIGAWTPGPAQAEGEPEKAVITRGVEALPPGRYLLKWINQSDSVRDVNGNNPVANKLDQQLEYAVEVGAETPRAIVSTLKRVLITMGPVDGKMLSYDSAAPAGQDVQALEAQFKHVLGLTSRASLAGGAIQPFAGLDAGWDKYAHGDEALRPVAAMNKRNFGDALLDRIFHADGWQYLPPRNPGEDRLELTVGQEWKVTRRLPGLRQQPQEVEQACVLERIKNRCALVKIAWTLNAMKPEMDNPLGPRSMYGVDEKGQTRLAIHLSSGLVIGQQTRVQRVDQVAVSEKAGDGQPPKITQTTVRSTSVQGFELMPREEGAAELPPVADLASPAEVVRSFLTAYKAKDLPGMGQYASQDAREKLKSLEGKGPEDKDYRRIFSGTLWDVVSAWDGKVGRARYPEARRAIVPFSAIPDAPGEVMVVILHQVDGKWVVHDFRSPKTAELEKMPAQEPAQAGPAREALADTPAAPASPAGVAKAFLTAYKAKDLPGMGKHGSQDAREKIKSIEGKGPEDRDYRRIFSGNWWKRVEEWDGRVGQTRYPQPRQALVEFMRDPEAPGEVMTVVLRWEDGAWVFHDFRSPSREEFEKMPEKPARD